jgi:hypothetical protein
MSASVQGINFFRIPPVLCNPAGIRFFFHHPIGATRLASVGLFFSGDMAVGHALVFISQYYSFACELQNIFV